MSSASTLGVLLSFLALMLGLMSSSVVTREECKTLQTRTVFSHHKTHELETGERLRLLCSTEVFVNKCEGYCTSRVSPSVVQYPGFKKDCKCCRESMLRNRILQLDECFDGDVLIPGQVYNLVIREPVDCVCSDCEI